MVINTSFPEQQERDGIIKQSALITKYFLHKKHETFTNKERIWKFKSSGGWRVGSQRSSRRQVCFDLRKPIREKFSAPSYQTKYASEPIIASLMRLTYSCCCCLLIRTQRFTGNRNQMSYSH